MKWKPIESAPKDGTFILLSGGYFYCEERDKRIYVPQVVSWYSNSWLISGCEGGYVWTTYESPTEWLSLDELQ